MACACARRLNERNSIGGVWNCVTIPEGRYDAEVAVRWSNGRRETALEARGIEVAAGQRLIVKAFERNRGAIDASFSEVRVQLEPDPAWGANATQAPEVDKSIPAAPPDSEPAEAKAPLGADSTSAAPAVAPPDQSPSPGIGASREGPHPVIQTAKVAGLVVLALALANLSNGESLVRLPDAIRNMLRRPGLGSDDEVYGTRYSVNRARYGGPSGPPTADCCFVWIEDGVTGKVLAGNRPIQN